MAEVTPAAAKTNAELAEGLGKKKKAKYSRSVTKGHRGYIYIHNAGVYIYIYNMLFVWSAHRKHGSWEQTERERERERLWMGG